MNARVLPLPHLEAAVARLTSTPTATALHGIPWIKAYGLERHRARARALIRITGKRHAWNCWIGLRASLAAEAIESVFGISPDDAADRADWDGEPIAWVQALEDAGCIDADGVPYDHEEREGKVLALMEADRLRKQDERKHAAEKAAAATATDAERKRKAREKKQAQRRAKAASAVPGGQAGQRGDSGGTEGGRPRDSAGTSTAEMAFERDKTALDNVRRTAPLKIEKEEEEEEERREEVLRTDLSQTAASTEPVEPAPAPVEVEAAPAVETVEVAAPVEAEIVEAVEPACPPPSSVLSLQEEPQEQPKQAALPRSAAAIVARYGARMRKAYSAAAGLPDADRHSIPSQVARFVDAGRAATCADERSLIRALAAWLTRDAKYAAESRAKHDAGEATRVAGDDAEARARAVHARYVERCKAAGAVPWSFDLWCNSGRPEGPPEASDDVTRHEGWKLLCASIAAAKSDPRQTPAPAPKEPQRPAPFVSLASADERKAARLRAMHELAAEREKVARLKAKGEGFTETKP